MSKKKKRVTLRDVARHAGVSPTAVSFAYNAPHQLSQTTREHILDTADALGYQPHPVARTLATGRTNSIGLLMPTSLNWMLHDPHFTHFLGEIGAVCDEEGKSISLVPVRGEVEPGTLATIAADGFLMFGIHRDHPLAKAIERSHRPVVLLDSDESIQAPMFNVDDRGGAYRAAQHMLDKGHIRLAIATMTPRQDSVIIPSFERRIEGFLQAIEEAGLSRSSVQMVHARGVLSAGYETFDRLWNLHPRPTAVFCVSDVRALGVLSGARKAGVSVPEELAVVGFGDLPDAAVSMPPLTTVARDMNTQPQMAIRTLLQLINEQVSETEFLAPHTGKTHLIVRESS